MPDPIGNNIVVGCPMPNSIGNNILVGSPMPDYIGREDCQCKLMLFFSGLKGCKDNQNAQNDSGKIQCYNFTYSNVSRSCGYLWLWS